MSKANPFAGVIDALGPGIDDLFADTGPRYSMVPLNMIAVKPQIRESFEDRENLLEDLAASIRMRGVLQPVLLRRTSEGYELVAGERRYRASRMAGLDQIPAYIRDMSDEEAEDAQLAENIHRKNLTQIEEARKIQRDLDRLGSVEAVLDKHQKSRPWLSKMLSLLALPDQARRLVTENVSADVEVIHAVRLIEKANPQAAQELVDELRTLRGRGNARERVNAVKEQVRPGKKIRVAADQAAPIFADAKISSGEGEAKPHIFASAKISSGKGEEGAKRHIFADAKNPRGREGEASPPQIFADAKIFPMNGSDSHDAVSQTLEMLWQRVHEAGDGPQAIMEALSPGQKQAVERWLQVRYGAAGKADNVACTVLHGLRSGEFAAQGQGALALAAFLRGSLPGSEFSLQEILESVRP